MWQKIKCFFGFHEWERGCYILTSDNDYCKMQGYKCEKCQFSFLICKHCYVRKEK